MLWNLSSELPNSKDLSPHPTAKAKESLLLPAEFTELKSEMIGVRDEMRESWRRMEEMFMAGIMGSIEGDGGPNERAKATTKIEVKSTAMLLYYQLHT